MLCRKFKHILFTQTCNNTVYHPLVQKRSLSKWFGCISGSNMTSTSRLKVFRNIVFARIFNAWARSAVVSTLVKRCRKEKGMREMISYFRHVFFRPRTHFLVYASVAYKKTEEKSGPPKRCSRNIKDKDMEKYIADLDGVEELSKATLFCEGCDKRIIIDSKHSGARYCDCKSSQPTAASYDGWMPYMETADIVIWRKEYKPGGLFAYKVYGRYKHVHAEDFALIQVDGSYRKVWDDAVASISVVEKDANGIHNQYVLHWEVMWPRLFTNRDYVYLRRHKEFTVNSKCLSHKDAIFPGAGPCTSANERISVHAHAKQASIDEDLRAARELSENSTETQENKVYVIVSRSCTHPKVPETKKAIRVMEYWSHMVITSLNGPDKPGMEFVLTYYDEPAVGGLPTAVTSWAMGRAGPAFVEKMRRAAETYRAWRRSRPLEDVPNFTPAPTNVSYDAHNEGFCEDKMESEKAIDKDIDVVPEVDTKLSLSEDMDEREMKEQATQTVPVTITLVDVTDVPPEAREDDSEDDDIQDRKIVITDSGFDSTEDSVDPMTKVIVSIIDKDSVSEDLIESSAQEEEVLSLEKGLLNQDITLEDVSHDSAGDKDAPCESDGDKETKAPEKDSDITEEDQPKTTWWRYLYPLYYFV